MQRRYVAAVLVVASTIGCGAPKSKGITLGAITSLTGAGANPRNLQAILLAVDEINALGGVNGSPLQIESRDDASNTDKATQMTQELVDLGLPAIIGPINSTRFLAAANLTVPAGRVQIGGAATSPAITSLVDNGFVFRTVPSDVNQGRLAATRAKAKGFTRMAVIHVSSTYGNGLADAFQTSFVAGGGTVTSNYTYVDNQTSYSQALSDILNVSQPPQAIFLIGVTKDAAQIIKDYNAGFSNTNTFWFFSDSLQNEFVTLTGANQFTFQHEGILSGTPETPQYNAFKSAYSAKYGEAPIGNVQNFYDATYLLALAMTAGQSSAPEAIRDNLTAVSAPSGVLYGATAYAAAVSDLKAGKDVDYDGASGNCDFDANGDVVSGYAITKVVNGAFAIEQPFVLP